MPLLRVARMETTLAKEEFRLPGRAEPVFRHQRLRFCPAHSEQAWTFFGLRPGEDDTIDLWLRDACPHFYRVPRRAGYRLAVFRPGDGVRVLHNAKKAFAAASGRESVSLE